MKLFLDANAHVPMEQSVLQSLTEFHGSLAGHGHPMSPSVPGREAANAMEESRAQIAELIGARSASQIVFTSTCTEACAWAVKIVHSVALENSFQVFRSPAEHPAVAQAIDATMPVCMQMPVSSDGVVTAIESYGKNEAVVCIDVQNETGVVQPVDRIAADFVFSDMSQAAGKMFMNVSQMPIDVAVFGAHKFGGPNLGFMYLRDPSNWEMFGTGSRYYLDRAGTPDVGSVVATAKALTLATESLGERKEKMMKFRDVLEPGLEELGFEIVSRNVLRCANTTFVSMPDGEGFRLMSALGEHGIYVGLGSACGSMHAGASTLMKKMGRTGGPLDYMRISQFGNYASKEAKLFLDVLRKCIFEGK